MRLERKRQHQRRKHDADSGKRLGKRPEFFRRTPEQNEGEQQVNRGKPERTERNAQLEALHQRDLQTKGDSGQRKDERPVHKPAQLRGLPQRVQHRHGEVQQEEGDEKRLSASKEARRVVQAAPDAARDKRSHIAQKVQRTPRLAPRDKQDAYV